jgi:hypothetical protein
MKHGVIAFLPTVTHTYIYIYIYIYTYSINETWCDSISAYYHTHTYIYIMKHGVIAFLT